MKILGTLLLLLISTVAYAGGGGDYQQEQTASPPFVINVPPSDNGNWVIPLVVGGLGLVGTLGAAYIGRNRITGRYGKKSSEK